MGRRPRRNHSPAFKAKVALDAIRGDKTIAELCEKHDLHANQIADWKHQLLERAHQNGHAERKEMIDPEHKLSITRQDELVNISRGSVYYLPVPTSATDLLLMRRIDELHLDFPFTGVRMLRDMLRREGHAVGRKHVSTLMAKIGIEALYRKPNTSKKHPGHKIYPYLLRGMTIVILASFP